MFHHHLDRPSFAGSGSSSYLPLVHITAGWTLTAWGLEALLPWTVWPLCLGLYVLAWVGWRYLLFCFKWGVYVTPPKNDDEGSE